MKCAEFINLLHDRIDGALPEADIERMRTHADICPECGARERALSALTEDLRAMGGEVPVPAALGAAQSLHHLICEPFKILI